MPIPNFFKSAAQSLMKDSLPAHIHMKPRTFSRATDPVPSKKVMTLEAYEAFRRKYLTTMNSRKPPEEKLPTDTQAMLNQMKATEARVRKAESEGTINKLPWRKLTPEEGEAFDKLLRESHTYGVY